MTIWWLAAILGGMAALLVGFIWMAIMLNRLQKAGNGKKSVSDLDKAYSDMAEEDATHLFNKAFREELRNRGRLRFERVIDENAMFLKQDLNLTTSQLNEYMKKQVADKLDVEFTAYAKAMRELQEMAQHSLQKAVGAAEEQRDAFSQKLKEDVAKREADVLKAYEENMAKIIEHYVLQALGDQFDLKAQLPFIIKQLEANKQAIKEDMQL
jgi:hypothetical protein